MVVAVVVVEVEVLSLERVDDGVVFSFWRVEAREVSLGSVRCMADVCI